MRLAGFKIEMDAPPARLMVALWTQGRLDYSLQRKIRTGTDDGETARRFSFGVGLSLHSA